MSSEQKEINKNKKVKKFKGITRIGEVPKPDIKKLIESELKNLDEYELNEIDAAIADHIDESDLREAQSKILGRQGVIANALKELADLPADVRKDASQRINALKTKAEEVFEERFAYLNDMKKEKSEDALSSDGARGSDLPYESHAVDKHVINKVVEKLETNNVPIIPSDVIDTKELEGKLLSKLAEREVLDSKIELLENKLGLAITEHLKSKRKLELIKLELVESYKKLMSLNHGEDKELDMQALINSISSLWPTNL